MGYKPSKLGNFTGGKWLDFDWWVFSACAADPKRTINIYIYMLSSDREIYEMASYKKLQIKLDWI